MGVCVTDTRSTFAMQMARAAAVLVFGLCTRGLYATAGCPDGWSGHSNRCYKVFGKPMSKQSDAAAECQKVGSELVKIETEGENQFLENLFNKARSDGVLARSANSTAGPWSGATTAARSLAF